jgi:diguanylate cyclase (GGDEF)-like protein
MVRFGISTLRSRLLLLLLLALVPALVLILITAWEQRDMAALDAQDHALRVARLAAQAHERLVGDAAALLLGLARTPEVLAPSPQACSALFAQTLRRAGYRRLAAATPEGQVFCAGVLDPTSLEPVDGDPVIQAARQRREPAVSGYRAGRDGPGLTVAVPALDSAGTLRAVVFATLDLGWLARVDERAALPEGSVVLALQRAGTVLAQFPDGDRWAGQRLPDSALARALRRLDREGRARAAGADGLPRFFGYAALPGLPGGEPLWVAVGISRDAAYAGPNRVLLRNLFSLGLVAVLALGATALVAHLLIFRRLGVLLGAAERLSAGDLGARAALGGDDEIGALGQAFDGMAERLAGMVRAEQEARGSLAERVGELGLLNRLGELLQACLSVEEAYVVMQRMVPRFFQGEAGAVFVVSGSRTLLEAVATWGPGPGEARTVFTPEECWALRTGRPHLVEDTASGLLCPHLPGSPPRAYLCVPLVAQSEALGVLYIASGAGAGPAIPEARRRLAGAVGEHLALGLANVKLREVLRGQSIRDPLTGLFNRRYMEETLEREVRRARRAERAMAVLMLDVDRFKDVNDTYDHDAGDALLRALGQCLRENLRREDIACRYGGDEFVLVLAEAELEGAARRAEELRQQVKALRVSDRGRLLPAVSISAGLAACPRHGTTGEALLRAADQALLAAKRGGRDRLVVAPDAPSEAAPPPRRAGPDLRG